jgi:chloride channel protein, CIC family
MRSNDYLSQSVKLRRPYLYRANKLLTWLQAKISPKQFLILGAIMVGLTAGLAAVIVKLFVHFILTNVDRLSPDSQVAVAALPFIGIGLSALFVRYVNRNRLGKGISNILYAIARKSSMLPKDQTYSHVVTSGLTIGFGGSLGLESPIVTTGAAIGSTFGRAYRLSYKERTLLLACGAAAGIAGAFNTPIAGVLFSLEVLLVEAGISAFIPILIAAAAGALCSKVILAEDVLLQFRLQELFDYTNVPFYMLLGIVCGLASFYYSRAFLFCEKFFAGFKKNSFVRWAIGGAMLFLLILFLPPLFGEGYNSIKHLSHLNPAVIFQNSPLKMIGQGAGIYLLLFLVLLLKPFATAITLGSGGNGGNFAPSLFMGAFLGFLFSSGLNELGIVSLPVSNFTLVAMAGILSGIFHAPLTGIFIIAEVTGGYELIIPLMIVSALSFAVSKYFMPLSIDMQKLARKEKIVVTDTDSYLLSHIKLSQFVESDFHEVQEDANLKKLVEAVAASRRNLFPVVDKESRLQGLITIDDIREIMFRPELHEKITVKELMRRPAYIITDKDDLRTAMKLFDESHLWNIPVVEGGKYKGFISKSTILEKYREALIQSSVE